MKYLFVGGAADGKHIEVDPNLISYDYQVTEKIQPYTFGDPLKAVNVDIERQTYVKKMLCYDADGIACYVFVERNIDDKQLLWRLVSNYKKVV